MSPSTHEAQVADIQDPTDGAKVLAASINPVDKAISTGGFPFRSYQPGDVLGFDGVAERSDGTRVYFQAPAAPFGSFAQFVDLSGAETVRVPDGMDPAVAAVIGVPGIAAWSAAIGVGGLKEGQTLLVTGATGSVGTLAAQIGLAVGARVVGTVRDADGVTALREIGVEGVAIDHIDAFEAQLHQAVPDGIDVVVDTVWGEQVAPIIRAMNRRSRFVQVGNAVGSATIVAPEFRNTLITMVGHSNFLLSPDQRSEAYTHVAQLVADGKVTIPYRQASLSDFADVWASKTPGKTVLIP
ncbi:MAG: zinc-binding alcohol dehydrogenase family protein [Actinomycetaceae bacterium]|nr:zinc-binding alcohol dehydrogenase family protein [Actinomycetaceae bacterium]MDY6083127.1 zinc-binding alcohol dehydrogenase family protein [Actinomycetaceae bacterium]